jgi:flagellar biosynthesis/type III secretory pathway protein FliH
LGYVTKRDALAAKPVRLRDEAARRAAVVIDEACACERLSRDRKRIADLASHMAERIVGDALTRRPELLDALYDRALAEVGSLRPGRIRVHPEDRRRSDVAARAAARGLEVVDDESVGRGGCVVEALGASSDHSLDAVLEALRAAVEGRTRG